MLRQGSQGFTGNVVDQDGTGGVGRVQARRPDIMDGQEPGTRRSAEVPPPSLGGADFPAVGEHADQQLVVEPPLARDSSRCDRRQRSRRHQLGQGRPQIHHTNVRAIDASVEGRLVTMHAAGSSSLSG